MITIGIDELLKWDKKSKELNNQIKNLQIENSNLKIDLEEKVSLLEVKQFAEEIKAPLKFTSAKNNLGVEEVFNEILMKKVYENDDQKVGVLNVEKGGSKINEGPKENYKGYWFMSYCNFF